MAQRVRTWGNGFVEFHIVVDKSILFAKWLARVCIRFFDKHERAIEDGRTGSDDSCLEEFVNIVSCYLFEMVW